MDGIAIIGAGLAGLTAAHALRGAGRRVTVFDKSRGTGGRLATRRTDIGLFDHGAPVAQGDPAFDVAMSDLGATRLNTGWSGRTGASGLVKPLIRDMNIMNGCRIVQVDGARGDWHLYDDAGGRHGPFDQLIVAIPAPQVQALIPEADLSDVSMAPCWTLMAQWPKVRRLQPMPPIAAIFPQKRTDAGVQAIVAHADAAWSARHIDEDPEEVKMRLIEALQAEGANPYPDHAVVHRWRYARTERALGRPFMRTDRGALLGGDWALGPNAGHAWRSGREMAKALLV